jgi:quinol monooxygenase YgiN
MFIANVALRVRPSKRPEALSTIRQLMRTMRSWPHCEGCRFFTAVDDDNSLILVSEWNSREALEQLLKSQEFLVLRGMRMLLQHDPEMVVDEVGTRKTLVLDG